MPYITGSLAISGSLVLFDGTNTVNFTATGSSANFTSSYTTTASYAATSGCTNKVNVFSTASGDTNMFVSLFPDLSTGCQYTYVDQGLRYDAVNNILYTTTEYATNAVLATSASYVLNAVSSSFATTANALNISSSTSTDTVVSLVMVPNQTTGSQPAIIDSKLYFNTADNVLTTDNLEVAANITSSGDLRFTAAGNAVVRPIINLIPDGTASYNPNSTNTTAYANYGINLITTASLTNYCFRLPQTPTKGKTVTIINNSGINVVIFPSVVGGEVNGIINGYSILPSDGKSYSFDCYENPLPGGWSLSNSPSTGNTTISTGEINWNYSSSSTSTIAYVNDSIKGFGGGTTFYPPMGSIFLNNYEASTNTFVVNGTTYSYAHGQILPDTIPGQDVWKSIDSIQIQTNITSSQAWWFNIPYALGNNLSYLYNPNNPNYSYPSSIGPWAGPSWFANSAYTNFSSSIYVPWFASRPGTSGGLFGSAAGGGLPYTISTVPGTFTPSQASPYASDNIGDPGTSILTISNIPAYIGSMSYRWLGRNFIGSFYHPSDGLIDVWYTQAFGLYLQKLGGAFIPNIKFITTLNVQI